MTGARWLEAHPGALARLGRAVRSGALGADVRFLALRSAPGFTGKGVLEEFADDSLRALAGLFGDFDRLGCAHDGRGGPEAEARLSLGNGRASGVLVISRLRSFADRLEIAGDKGRAVLDQRTGSLTAQPPDLLDDLPQPEPAVGSYKAKRDLREGAEALRHPWEPAPARPFPGLGGRRVLVTGSTGFIGARVVERLAEEGAAVTAGLRSMAKAARIARLGVELAPMGPGWDLCSLVRGQDAVVNLAHDFDAAAARNEAVSHALADACEAEGVELLVQASSIAVYDGWPGDPLDESSPSDGPGHDYKLLKRAIERDLEGRAAAGRLRSVILQPTIVYGAFSALWTDRFAERFAIGDVAVPEGGLCEGVHVDDVADAILAAIASEGAGGRYIVSGPAPFAWSELLAAGSAACPGWGALRIEPALPPAPATDGAAHGGSPGWLARLKGGIVRAAAGFVRRRLGEQRLAQLRGLALKAVARGRRPIYRPAAESPRLFANRAAVSTARMRRDLAAPVVTIERGAELVRAYLAWRHCPFDQPAGED